MARRALVTGSAGFIGFHMCRRLLEAGWEVTGLDGMTTYYDVALKERRLGILKQHPGFTPVEAMVEEPGRVMGLVAEGRPEVIIHLAAQAGVRYSHRNAARLCRGEPDRHVRGAGSRAGASARASADRLDLFGLRREHDDALCRDGQGRPPDELLRRDQEGDRGDGAFLCASVRHPHHDVPLLHGLRPLGAARHGAVQVHARDPRGRADRASTTTAT